MSFSHGIAHSLLATVLILVSAQAFRKLKLQYFIMDDREAREAPALFPGVLLAVNCYTEGTPVSLHPS